MILSDKNRNCSTEEAALQKDPHRAILKNKIQIKNEWALPFFNKITKHCKETTKM